MNVMIDAAKVMSLCKYYDVYIEFTSLSLIIRKFGDIEGRNYKYSQAFLLEDIDLFGLERCIEIFDTRFNKELERLKNEYSES